MNHDGDDEKKREQTTTLDDERTKRIADVLDDMIARDRRPIAELTVTDAQEAKQPPRADAPPPQVIIGHADRVVINSPPATAPAPAAEPGPTTKQKRRLTWAEIEGLLQPRESEPAPYSLPSLSQSPHWLVGTPRSDREESGLDLLGADDPHAPPSVPLIERAVQWWGERSTGEKIAIGVGASVVGIGLVAALAKAGGDNEWVGATGGSPTAMDAVMHINGATTDEERDARAGEAYEALGVRKMNAAQRAMLHSEMVEAETESALAGQRTQINGLGDAVNFVGQRAADAQATAHEAHALGARNTERIADVAISSQRADTALHERLNLTEQQRAAERAADREDLVYERQLARDERHRAERAQQRHHGEIIAERKRAERNADRAERAAARRTESRPAPTVARDDGAEKLASQIDQVLATHGDK
jgi:hypothetical protein